MVVSNLAAPLAGNDYHHDRSDEAELAVVAARGEVAAALNYRLAKFTALLREKRYVWDCRGVYVAM